MSRLIVGPVAGGHPQRNFPDWPLQDQFDDLAAHARGRMESLAGQMFLLLKLKSRGLIADPSFISFGGAVVQDLRGGPGYVAAHRAIGGLRVRGVSIDVLPGVVENPLLRRMFWSTDAATDFVQPGPVNYGNGPVERMAKQRLPPKLDLFLNCQKATGRLETNLCADAINILQQELITVHDDIGNDYVDRLARRGKPLYHIDNRRLGTLPDAPFRSRQRAPFQDFASVSKSPYSNLALPEWPGPPADGKNLRMIKNPSEEPYASDVSIGLQRNEIARFSPDLESA